MDSKEFFYYAFLTTGIIVGLIWGESIANNYLLPNQQTPVMPMAANNGGTLQVMG